MPKEFYEYIQDATRIITQANTTGILVYAEEYIAAHPELNINQRTNLISGHTNYPELFLQYRAIPADYPIMKFRLQPNISASAALTTLIRGDKSSIIDCMTVITIAYHYAVLLALQDHYGTELGNERFDLLFGHAALELPSIQRLFFGNNFLTREHLVGAANHIIPLSMLSYIFKQSEVAKLAFAFATKGTVITAKIRAQLLAKIPVGTMLAFAGHPGYADKHPQGSHGNYNGIVIANDPEHGVLLWVFGLGPLTEAQLRARHLAAYNQDCTAEDLSVHEQIRCLGKEVHYPQTITAADIPGLSVKSHFTIIPEHLNAMLFAPLPELVPKMYRCFTVLQQQRQEILKTPAYARFAALIRREDSMPLPEPSAAFIKLIDTHQHHARLQRKATTPQHDADVASAGVSGAGAAATATTDTAVVVVAGANAASASNAATSTSIGVAKARPL